MPTCYICDKSIDEVHLDHRDMKPRPCSECEQIINELVLSYKDTEEQQDDGDELITYMESDIVEYGEEVAACEFDLDHSRS